MTGLAPRPCSTVGCGSLALRLRGAGDASTAAAVGAVNGAARPLLDELPSSDSSESYEQLAFDEEDSEDQAYMRRRGMLRAQEDQGGHPRDSETKRVHEGQEWDLLEYGSEVGAPMNYSVAGAHARERDALPERITRESWTLAEALQDLKEHPLELSDMEEGSGGGGGGLLDTAPTQVQLEADPLGALEAWLRAAGGGAPRRSIGGKIDRALPAYLRPKGYKRCARPSAFPPPLSPPSVRTQLPRRHGHRAGVSGGARVSSSAELESERRARARARRRQPQEERPVGLSEVHSAQGVAGA